MKMNRKYNFAKDKIWTILLFILVSSNNLLASTEESSDGFYSVIKFMLGLTVLILLFVLWLVLVYSERNDNRGKAFLSVWKSVLNVVDTTVPMEKEKEILLDHDYDGIFELDNKIPPWFSFLFYGTIIFGILYMVQYHVVQDGNIQTREYNEEVAVATAQREILIKTGAFISEESATLVTDAASLLSGKDVYTKNCAACHGQAGEGLVGPNMTDEYWIHGGGVKDLFKTIKYGVPSKGMISWEQQLNPKQIQEVSSYILQSLQGTNPPNGKQPEGEKYVKEESKNI
ncbi:MAG: c-type cytochrome [Melioribacteraceae bacterium]|nr:c-type cytochrome [Melioribacteraceae bacterium]